MHRFPPPVRSLGTLFALVFALTVSLSSAEEPAESAALSCQPIERELAQVTDALAEAKRALAQFQGQSAELEAVRAALSQTERDLQVSRETTSSCQSLRENLCNSTRELVHKINLGQVDTTGVSECVDVADRQGLVRQLSGWTNVMKGLARFQAYSAGESDVNPRLGPTSGSKVETLLAQALGPGGGAPLIFRRILIEAIELLAPRTWAKQKAKPGGVTNWFMDAEGLSSEFIEEVRDEEGTRRNTRTTDAPLTTALGLISVYEMLAGCGTDRPAQDCVRALQLKTLINASGPLVAQRRIEDIWSSDCASVTGTQIGSWVSDLPIDEEADDDTRAVDEAVRGKLFTCFLRDSAAPPSFSAWLRPKLPDPQQLRVDVGEHLKDLHNTFRHGSSGDRCGRAIRALQNLPTPSSCEAPQDLITALSAWARSAPDENSFALGACDRYVRTLWAGDSATLGNSFPTPPTIEDAVRLIEDAPPSNVRRLRDLCSDRVGGPTFARSVVSLGELGEKLGENAKLAPWYVDSESRLPLEAVRATRGRSASKWLESWISDDLACSTLELDESRCAACRDLPSEDHYDCAQLNQVKQVWRNRTHKVLLIGTMGILVLSLLVWLLYWHRSNKRYGGWHRQTKVHLERLGMTPLRDRLKYLLPEHLTRLVVPLPASSTWEPWGKRAVVVRSDDDKLRDSDVNRAGSLGLQLGASLVFLVHRDQAAPDLSAVRAILDWAARGGSRAVHVLTLSGSRFSWARSTTDLLELADESSLRSNPFEVRGRVTNSSQFFNRERLVSGLLATVQGGHFCVITGLRRFGKSSLALEVARRVPGPSAYVDLAGFHHEIRFAEDPALAVDSILRYSCTQLLESARLQVRHEIALEVPPGAMDAVALSTWFRDFLRAIRRADDTSSVPILLVFDEVEQAIGSAQDLNRALDVLAILVGRLRNSLPGTARQSNDKVGVLFASALHPLLWSPLGTLAHQSIVGSFQYVAVPCLPREATVSMMQALGSRQGISFTEESLELLVRESQGVPLLARRLGTTLLELYDTDRARQGALGAVQIGVEGVRAALEREESEGSPSRVWIESEIAEATNPGGAVLRALAQVEWLSAKAIRRIASQAFQREFEITGVAMTLRQDEALRRAQEAAGVVVRILGDSGLLKSRGDPTEPDGYELPDGIIRRVLANSNSSA